MLERLRSGQRIPEAEVFEMGENCPGEFFRIVVEALSDSFDAADAAIYNELMQAWPVRAATRSSRGANRVYVLSRVTLGADIKITSMVLDAMKRRFPGSSVILVGGRKSAELFRHDLHLEVNYPRTGPTSTRIAFAIKLREQLADGIVVDPDSRISQLGHVPMAAEGDYFHFNSRVAGGKSLHNLSDLTARWLRATFDVSGDAYIAPSIAEIDDDGAFAAISLGVGENESKRIPGSFEADLIRDVGTCFSTVWIDRGAGGEEARRVTAAAQASGIMERVRFWEGSFAGFASIIQRSAYYAGYDSGGQHAAAAAGVPLTTYFAGASSLRFASRWRPQGKGRISVRLR